MDEEAAAGQPVQDLPEQAAVIVHSQLESLGEDAGEQRVVAGRGYHRQEPCEEPMSLPGGRAVSLRRGRPVVETGAVS
jgi:hypothetical protein